MTGLQTLLRAGREAFSPAGVVADVPGMSDFERSAEGVMSRQSTQRAQTVVRVTVAVVVVLLVWAAFARVDEVTRGEGRVVPSKQLTPPPSVPIQIRPRWSSWIARTIMPPSPSLVA